MAGGWSWVRGIRSAPEVQPLSLARVAAGNVVAGACIVAIVVVTGLETWRPALASLGSLLFIPVLVSSWMLGGPQALAVSALAVSARFVGYSAAGIDVETAVAEVITLLALATMTRMAALGLVEGRERRAREIRERQALDLQEQRDRIALTVTNTAIRRLFAVTLQLEAASAQLHDPTIKPSLDRAIAELDALNTEFRALVFGDSQAETQHLP